MARKPESHRAGHNGQALPAWLRAEAFSEEEIELYLDAAGRCGLEVSHWARQMLNAAAREILELDDSIPR
jgi:hypothetical protein